jgi:hypothetical protein
LPPLLVKEVKVKNGGKWGKEDGNFVVVTPHHAQQHDRQQQ